MGNSTDLHQLVPWQSGPTERGGWSIIFSCLAVVITSTWTALHLNVPDQPNTALSIPKSFPLTRKKIKWTIIMIMLPEVVFAKAVLELKMALDDQMSMHERQRSFRLKGWRVNIAFWSYALHQLLDGQWPSKARWRNYYSTVDIHQSGHNIEQDQQLEPIENFEAWTNFRPSQCPSSCGHEEADLEWTLTHSYFANMGGITFKSCVATTIDLVRTLDILSYEHQNVRDKERAGAMTVMRASNLTDRLIKDKSKADMLLRAFWLWQMVRLWCELVARATAKLPVTQVEIITLSFSLLALFIHGLQSSKPKDVESPINFDHKELSLKRRFEDFETLSYAYLIPTKSADRIYSPGTSVPNDIFREGDGTLFLLTTTSSTILFGAIHCIAWQFKFPTTIERWTWRACALASIILPLVMLILAWIGNRGLMPLDERRDSAKSQFESACNIYRTETKGTLVDNLSIKCYYNRPLTQLVQSLIEGASPVQLPEEIGAHITRLHDLASNLDAGNSARGKFLRHRTYYQYPVFIIYLMTRIAIMFIAFTSFQKAPRRVYKGTWAFWPTFQ